MVHNILGIVGNENRVVTIVVGVLFSIGHKDKIHKLLFPYVDLKDKEDFQDL